MAVGVTTPSSNAYTVQLLEADLGTGLSSIDTGENAVLALAYSPSGAMLAYATNVYSQLANGLPAWDRGTLHLIDTSTGEDIFTIPNEQAIVGPIFFTPDEKTLAYVNKDYLTEGLMGSGGQEIHFVDLATGDESNRQTMDSLITSFSADGSLMVASAARTLYAVGSNGTSHMMQTAWEPVRVIETATGQDRVSIDYSSELLVTSPPAFSADSSLLAIITINENSDMMNQLRLWDLVTATEIAAHDIGTSFFSRVVFSPDGKLLATLLSETGTVTLWGIASPDACVAIAGGNVNLRSGPGTEFDQVGTFSSGTNAYVNAQAADASGFVWWHLISGAWVRSDLVTTAGTCESVTVIVSE